MKTIFALAGLLALATPSHADSYTMTVSGTISPWQWNGFSYVTGATLDRDGFFGPVGASLTSDPFLVVWQFLDTSHLISGTLIINDHGMVLGTDGYISAILNTNSGAYAGVTVALISPFNTLPDNIQMNTFIYSNNIPPEFEPFSYGFNPLTDNLTFPHQLGGAFNLGGWAKGYFDVERITLAHMPSPVVGAGWFFVLLGGTLFLSKKHILTLLRRA